MPERTVGQSMSRRPLVSLPPGATVREAARVMTRAQCGSVLVLDPAGAMLGIVTERDLMTRVLAKDREPDGTTLEDIMTRHPRVTSPQTLVSDAVLVMIEHGFRHLPVVEADGRIVGVLSARDALPREVSAAASLADFHEQVNDALG